MRYFTVIGSSIEEITSKILKEYKGKAYIINMNKETQTKSVPRSWYLKPFLKPKIENVIAYKAYCALPENLEEMQKPYQKVKKESEVQKEKDSVKDNKNESVDNKKSLESDSESNAKDPKNPKDGLKDDSQDDSRLTFQNHLLKQELDDLKSMMNYLVHKEEYFLDNEQLSHLLQLDFSYHFSKDLIENFSVPVKNLDMFKTIIKEKLKLSIPVQKGVSYNQGECYLFIGSTGIGKTTTLAKVAASFFKEGLRDFVFMSFDSYKLGADEQLKRYAKVFEKDFYLIQNQEDFSKALEVIPTASVVFMDTAGESLEKEVRLSEIKDYLEHLHRRVNIFLVISANAKINDLILMKEKFKDFSIGAYIITKVDETKSLGSILEFLYKQTDNIPVVYYTNGQDVPDDIKKMDLDTLFKYF